MRRAVVVICWSVGFVRFVPIAMVFLIKARCCHLQRTSADDRTTDCLLFDEGEGGSNGFDNVTISTGPLSSLSSSGKFYNPGLAFGWEDEEGGSGGQWQAMQARQVGSIGNASLNKLKK
jgi:hypothetical protein